MEPAGLHVSDAVVAAAAEGVHCLAGREEGSHAFWAGDAWDDVSGDEVVWETEQGEGQWRLWVIGA